MCQTYANFSCASVVNYTYKAGNGWKESSRACVTASLPILPLTVHCTVNTFSDYTWPVCVFGNSFLYNDAVSFHHAVDYP